MMGSTAGAVSDRPARDRNARTWLAISRSFAAVLAILMVTIVGISALGAALDEPQLAGDIVALAIPAFVAGMLSILSPCSLPIIAGYFSLALQEHRDDVGRMTLGFLLGVGTTMAVIGAGFTALGSLAIDYQRELSFVGGSVIIVFGVMSLVGKGFGGLRILRRPAATGGGAYLYGLIFALGWTTCVGPILGSVLTLLLAEGSSSAGVLSLLAGGTLSLIYVMGLGLPILLIVSLLTAAGPRGRGMRVLRGRGWEFGFFGRALHVHSTSLVSGVLLIALGFMLLSGEMTALSERLSSSPLTELGLELEKRVDSWL